MRILHLCDSLNPAGLGGYESYLHYLIPELEMSGHEAAVVSQTSTRGVSGRRESENYDLYYLTGNLLEARKWEFYKRTAEDRQRLAEEMFQENDVVENVAILSRELLSLLNQQKPDIIHAHSTYVVFNRVLQRLKQAGHLDGIPLLLTIHGREKPLILPGQVETTDYKQLAESCPFDRILAVSRNVAAQLEEHLRGAGLSTAVQTAYLGVNLETFKPDPDRKKKWDIAFLGRLEPMKSVDLLPEMLSLLVPHIPDLRMLLTGEGTLREQIMREFNDRGLASRVEYQGVVPSGRVIDLIQESRIVLYPSREEPFGLAIVEAMACGVPVISTNRFGPSEIITHLKDGYLIDSIDARTLADAVHELLQNREMREAMARSARNTVENRFDLKHHTKLIEAIYTELRPT